MTNIRVINDKDDGAVSIAIVGHAEYAEPGKDIVCASVSILSYTLAQCLQKEEDKGNLEYLMLDMESGSVHITYIPLKNKRQIQTVLDTVLTGFSLLSDTYPNNVSIL